MFVRLIDTVDSGEAFLGGPYCIARAGAMAPKLRKASMLSGPLMQEGANLRRNVSERGRGFD
jgi:hypothetical protein